jgi:hypothetical protein
MGIRNICQRQGDGQACRLVFARQNAGKTIDGFGPAKPEQFSRTGSARSQRQVWPLDQHEEVFETLLIGNSCSGSGSGCGSGLSFGLGRRGVSWKKGH